MAAAPFPASLWARLPSFAEELVPAIGREGPVRAFRRSIPLRVADQPQPKVGTWGREEVGALAKRATAQGLSPEDHTPLFPTRFGSDVLHEFDDASGWAKGLWVAALLIGILDALRWHSGAGFAYDSQPAWQSAHAILHGGAHWA